jgi:plastocyanin
MGKIFKGFGLLIAGALVAVTILVPIACKSGYGTTASTTPASASSGNVVTISNFSFSPATLNVAAGTTVIWTNKDSVTHTVTSDSGLFNSGNLSPDSNFSYTFGSAGTFTYHCAIHTYMTGTVMVK